MYWPCSKEGKKKGGGGRATGSDSRTFSGWRSGRRFYPRKRKKEESQGPGKRNELRKSQKKKKKRRGRERVGGPSGPGPTSFVYWGKKSHFFASFVPFAKKKGEGRKKFAPGRLRQKKKKNSLCGKKKKRGVKRRRSQ